MNSRDGIDYDAMQTAMLACTGTPFSSVFDTEAPVPLHLFHFTPDFGESPLIYAHRNGHGSMICKLKEGGWRLTKYWKDRTEVNRFPTRFERDTPQLLFPLISKGDEELLTLLPYDATRSGPRLAAFRERLLEVHWARGSDTFTLKSLEASTHGLQSSPFEGKLWDSREAALWCDQMIPSMRRSLEIERAGDAMQATVGDLEDHPLAFMF